MQILYTETSSLRTLKIMPRNLNGITLKNSASAFEYIYNKDTADPVHSQLTTESVQMYLLVHILYMSEWQNAGGARSCMHICKKSIWPGSWNFCQIALLENRILRNQPACKALHTVSAEILQHHMVLVVLRTGMPVYSMLSWETRNRNRWWLCQLQV